MTSAGRMGRVMSSSKVPWRWSSAHRRMLMAGTKKVSSRGMVPKKPRMSAWPMRKKFSMKSMLVSNRKTMMKM